MYLFENINQIVQDYLPKEHISLLKQAYIVARDAHKGQTRSSGEPYITHPGAVAYILAEMHLDHETLIAALLHDLIEDTPTTFQDIKQLFGKTIAGLVEGVSKLDKLTFRDKKEAQAENFRKMIMAMVQDIRVILIKLADRMHNMRTLDSLRADKRRRIARETLEIYSPLAYRLGIHCLKTELEELGFKGLYPNRYRVIKKVIKLSNNNQKEMIHKILTKIENKLFEGKISYRIYNQKKHLYSIYRKMHIKGQCFQSIVDIYEFRIIVKDIDTCYRVLGKVHSLYNPRPGYMKDYIATPKANGYQSLHTSMIGPHGLPIEIQIRTEDMNQMVEMGVAARWSYKKQKEFSTIAQIRVQRWMQSLLELQQNSGNSFEFIENVKSDFFPDEIYVFTPEGKIIELPTGATPVDFAYAVHTDIGHACIGARVNNQPYSLSQSLTTGQTIEIITASYARPNEAWLNFVISSKTKTKIRQLFKNLKRENLVTLGCSSLNHVLGKDKKLSDIFQENINKKIKKMKLNSINDLFYEISFDNAMSIIVANNLLGNININNVIRDNNNYYYNYYNKLSIKGAKEVLITFSKCCYQIPDDLIITHISQGKDLMIHHESCCNILNYHQNKQEKFIQIEWNKRVLIIILLLKLKLI